MLTLIKRLLLYQSTQEKAGLLHLDIYNLILLYSSLHKRGVFKSKLLKNLLLLLFR